MLYYRARIVTHLGAMIYNMTEGGRRGHVRETTPPDECDTIEGDG